ncbi:hypothetical protein PFLUV_G00185960 [Perca fluviatilis]|uniref:Uncharacterized protein n=1 Tax=Perca fluviatilis TaxID=8168 RepID=A0A6A5EQ09_PERFL|nr:hypothetical protein PFLUV_G00185960 [Perca fluviatilis]
MALLTFIQSLEVHDQFDLQMQFGENIIVVSFVDLMMNYKSYSLLEIVYRLLKSVRINGEMLGRVLLKKLLSLLYRAGLWLKRKFHCVSYREINGIAAYTLLRNYDISSQIPATVQQLFNPLQMRKRRHKRVGAVLQTRWSGVGSNTTNLNRPAIRENTMPR